MGAAAFFSGTKVQAFQLYTLSSTVSNSTDPTRFGVVDVNSGAYTNITNLTGFPYRNLVLNGDTFLTTRRNGANGQLASLTRTGVASPIGTVGRTLYGMSRSPQGSLYGYDVATDIVGRINPATGGWTAVGSSGVGMVNNTTNSTGGKLAFHNGSLYIAARTNSPTPTQTRFGTIDLTTGAMTTITTSNPLMQYMTLASYGGVLYGLYANGATATPAVLPGIYTIDIATGASTRIRDITGFGANYYFHGAAAPAPLPMLGAAAVFGSVRKLRGFTKRLSVLKQIA
ncbi:MAG: hypothetical protein VKP70_12195 [Cyanobacteriota bacterium]|nr:hypothetical protein [Cyanobacteriota bacterium]